MDKLRHCKRGCKYKDAELTGRVNGDKAEMESLVITTSPVGLVVAVPSASMSSRVFDSSPLVAGLPESSRTRGLPSTSLFPYALLRAKVCRTPEQ